MQANWDYKTKLKLLVLFVLVLVVFLLSSLYLAYQPNSNFYGKVISHIQTTQKVVALTFDDGPNGDATLKVLDILKTQKIPATFFLVGDNVQYYPRIAKQIADDGFEIENHSLHHDRTLPFDTKRDIEGELLQANKIIFDATGQTPKFFRPPHGFRTPWAITAAQRAGFLVVTWNDLTTDYKNPPAAQIEKSILASIKPGSIIVLHDGFGTAHAANRDQMLKALPVIIQTLKQQGYSFNTLSQLYGLSIPTPVPVNQQ